MSCCAQNWLCRCEHLTSFGGFVEPLVNWYLWALVSVVIGESSWEMSIKLTWGLV